MSIYFVRLFTFGITDALVLMVLAFSRFSRRSIVEGLGCVQKEYFGEQSQTE